MRILIEDDGDRILVTGNEADREAIRRITDQARQMQAGAALTPEAMRAAGLRFAASPLGRPGPDPADLLCVDAGGAQAVWFEPKGAPRPGPILYLHGGGYVGGSIAASRGVAQSLADAFGARVLALAYRQAPEHPFPAAVDDARAAYVWLTAQTTAPITVVGDSAGAALALDVALAASGTDRSAHAVIAMSGVFDLTMSGESWTTNAARDVVSREMGEFFFGAYMAGQDRHDPRASAVFADFAGAPPLLLQTGACELMRSDNETVAARARAQGVAVRLEIYTDMPHNFGKFVGGVADLALARAAAWERDL